MFLYSACNITSLVGKELESTHIAMGLEPNSWRQYGLCPLSLTQTLSRVVQGERHQMGAEIHTSPQLSAALLEFSLENKMVAIMAAI